MMGFGGIFRGQVESRDDPEERRRYRVRVHNVHRPETPVEHLPWAETCNFQGKGFGTFCQFDVGDLVWVAFEGGSDGGPDRKKPVILGGWLANLGGTPDMPVQLSSDYPRSSERQVFVDRRGNTIELSELDEELHIRIQSGASKLLIRQLDGTIEIEAEQRVFVRAPKVHVTGGEEVTVITKKLTAAVEDTAYVDCENEMHIRSSKLITIGQHDRGDQINTTDKLREQLNLEHLLEVGPSQTPVSGVAEDPVPQVRVRAKSDGTLDTDTVGDITTDSQASVKTNASVDILIHADANVQISANGKMDLSSAGTLTLSSQAMIQMQAPVVTIDADTAIQIASKGSLVQTSTTTYAVQSGGNMSFISGANCAMTAATTFTYGAPQVIGTAVASMSMDGGAYLALNGLTIDVGL